MFSQSRRLTKRSEIQRVYKKGRKYYAKELGLRVLMYKKDEAPEDRSANIKFAVVVANKVSKKAAERNLIKRRIREAIKKEAFSDSLIADVLIQGLPAAKGLTYKELSDILHSLLVSAKLI